MTTLIGCRLSSLVVCNAVKHSTCLQRLSTKLRTRNISSRVSCTLKFNRRNVSPVTLKKGSSSIWKIQAMENSVSATSSTKTNGDAVKENEKSSLTADENKEIQSDLEKDATNKKSTKKGALGKAPAKASSRRPSRNAASKATSQNGVKDVKSSEVEDDVETITFQEPVKPSRKRKTASKDDGGSSKYSEVEDNGETRIVHEPVKPSCKRKAASRDDGKPSKATEVEDLEIKAFEEPVKSSYKRKVASKNSQQKEAVQVSASDKSNVHGDVDKSQPWMLLVHKKLQPDWVAYNPARMRKPTPPEGYLKLFSWNVNGLRALLKVKGVNPVFNLAQKENLDVLCLQETKLQEKDVDPIKDSLLPGYDHSFWSCSQTKLGYSGTAIISRIKPISVTYGLGLANHDDEGRLITLEFEKFYLVAGYIPNSGQKLERLTYRTQDWDLCLANYVKDLEINKPVILTGDLNCAHQEIDIYNPDGNRRSAGFTDEERTSFEEHFLKRGLFDTFRKQHPNSVAYTYWGYRTAARPKNQGWRLDYFLVSDILSESIYDSYICPDVGGSDHCPIGLILKA